jgi:hypothetical protein
MQALAGFVHSIYRTAVQSANQYTMGSKDFLVKLNDIDYTLKFEFFMKLWSLPETAHCVFLIRRTIERAFAYLFYTEYK